jgi:general stress protein YciG
MRLMGRKGGKASGKARMVKMTPEERSEVARKAAAKSAGVRSKKAAAKKKARKKSGT